MNCQNSPRKSYLLCDLYRHRQKHLQLGDITSHIEEFSRDRLGSKFIQQKLRDASEHRKYLVYEEIKPILLSLMKDKFANFVMQRFYEIATTEQRNEIFNCIFINLRELSFNIYGCRVVQFVIEITTIENKIRILEHLVGSVITYAQDQHAHHILIKCLTHFPFKEMLDFINKEYRGIVAQECMHQYSCRIVQQILETGTHLQKQLAFLEISFATLAIVRDRYGNYVIQSVLRYGDGPWAQNILREILEHFWQLSQDKYASNVAEKCVDRLQPDMVDYIYEQLMRLTDEQLVGLCKHQFANFTIQKLIPMLNILQRAFLLDRLSPYVHNLARHLGARKIISALNEPDILNQFQ